MNPLRVPVKILMESAGLCLCLILTACDSGSQSEQTMSQQEMSQQEMTQQQKPAGVIPQAQLKALEKAKGVEDVIADAEAQRRKQMEQQQ